MVTVSGSHLSKTASLLGPNSTKTLQSTSVKQPPLYKGQLELAHRWLHVKLDWKPQNHCTPPQYD